MKIAIWHNLLSGGGKRALFDHVSGLVARGHTVEAWCPPTADRGYLPLSSIVPEHVVDLDWPMPFRRLDEWQITLESERAVAAMDAHCRACAAEIEAGGFDVLLANSCQFFATTAIGRMTALPSVLYLQEPYRLLYEAIPRLRWLARPREIRSRLRLSTYRSAFADLRRIRNWRLQAREEVANAAAFDRILVNSYFSRESVLRSYGLDAQVCYLGIDTRQFADAGLPREDYVVGLGSISPLKNIRLCIEALALIPQPRPRLVWVGNMIEQHHADEMQRLAEALDVVFEPRVRISDTALRDILNRAMAMLYAPRLEPFGLAPLEAAACGVPVIAVAEGGVRETVVDGVTGMLVANDPAAMAHAIARLREDSPLARRLGQAARANVVEKWDVAAAVLRIEECLRRYAKPS